jgi:hypothetical protein
VPVAIPISLSGQTQNVTLSTTSSTQVVSESNGVTLTTIFPANAVAATVAVTLSTAPPSGAPTVNAIAYLTVTSTSNIYVGLPTFTVSATNGTTGANAYAAYTIESSNGALVWVDYSGPVTETTAPFTLAPPDLPVSLIPAPTIEIAATQPQDFTVYSK